MSTEAIRSTAEALARVGDMVEAHCLDSGYATIDCPDDEYADLVRAVAVDIPSPMVRQELARRTGVPIGDFDPLAD